MCTSSRAHTPHQQQVPRQETRKPHHRHATTTEHALGQHNVSPARVQYATGQALFGSAGCCSGGHCAVARKCREALELCSPPPPPPLAALIQHISTACSLQGKTTAPAHVNSPPHRCTNLHFLPRPQGTLVHARTPPACNRNPPMPTAHRAMRGPASRARVPLSSARCRMAAAAFPNSRDPLPFQRRASCTRAGAGVLRQRLASLSPLMNGWRRASLGDRRLPATARAAQLQSCK